MCVVVGVVVQLFVTASIMHGVHFHDTTARVLNVFAFFTIQSNILVGVTSLWLAARPDASAPVFRVARLMGLVGIVVTGIVYHVALRAYLELDSWGLVADHLLHTVVPILAIVGWLLYGPRRLTSSAVASATVLYPVAWVTFTMIRGAAIHWYPYPFIDVDRLGYLKVAANCVWVALLVFGIAAGATAVDRRLAVGPAPPETDA